MDSNTTIVSINPPSTWITTPSYSNSNTTIVSINHAILDEHKYDYKNSNTTIVSINLKNLAIGGNKKMTFKYNYCFY